MIGFITKHADSAPVQTCTKGIKREIDFECSNNKCFDLFYVLAFELTVTFNATPYATLYYVEGTGYDKMRGLFYCRLLILNSLSVAPSIKPIICSKCEIKISA